jgi:uncharacterized SAM-binding protein YcdF (DUF218 family)
MMTLSIRTLLYDVLLLLELGLFFLFFAPLFLRIFNAGNLFGMAVSAICFLLTLFHRPFGQLLSRIWGNLCGKCVLSILALLLTAGIAFAGFCSVKMVQYYQNPPQTPCTVVVLGCKVKGTVPSLMLQRRLEAAKDYLQQHPDIPCIVSGGKGTGEDISEAQAMKDYLCAHGIEASRIFMEAQSTDTEKNIAYSARFIPDKNAKIGVVSNDFHLLRAGMLVRAKGFHNVSTIAARSDEVLFLNYRVREYFGVLKDLFGVKFFHFIGE